MLSKSRLPCVVSEILQSGDRDHFIRRSFACPVIDLSGVFQKTGMISLQRSDVTTSIAAVGDACHDLSAAHQGRMVPGEGFEPPTFGLQNRCTTTVLTRRQGGPFERKQRHPSRENVLSLTVFHEARLQTSLDMQRRLFSTRGFALHKPSRCVRKARRPASGRSQRGKDCRRSERDRKDRPALQARSGHPARLEQSPDSPP